MDGAAWLGEVVDQYRYRKGQCERAIEQVTEGQLFETAGRIPLCLAAQMKHIGGNHRSRWRDFLTTDGEKPDRNRDDEFVLEGETPESIREQWDEGWSITFESLGGLGGVARPGPELPGCQDPGIGSGGRTAEAR